MKRSRGSFEDFLEQLEEVRFNLEPDCNEVRAGSREKLCRPPGNQVRKFEKRFASGRNRVWLRFDSMGRNEMVSKGFKPKRTAPTLKFTN
jgi:hypothetical protein